MSTWHYKYKLLAIGTLLFIVGAALTYFTYLRPLNNELAKRHSDVRRMTSEMQEQNWPVDPDKLDKVRQQQQNRLNTLKLNLAETQDRAQATFSARIKSKYGPDAVDDPKKFIHYASSLDYQIYYEEITSKWRKKRIPLEPAMLKISKDSSSERIYQSVLQLWSLDKILTVVSESGLRPTVKKVRINKSGDNGNREEMPPSAYQSIRAASITLTPIKRYLTEDQAEDFFLLEMPVQMTVQCSPSELKTFLKSLNNGDSLIPLNSIEIQKIPPRNPDEKSSLLEVKMECSTFYPLRIENTIEINKTRAPLPAGA
ncbi:MAG: hypothetical protein R6V56_02245 [Lentisphaeria bacterium]